ncbi:hypothetical protein Tco_0163055 [Tanacetum coccineum]
MSVMAGSVWCLACLGLDECWAAGCGIWGGVAGTGTGSWLKGSCVIIGVILIKKALSMIVRRIDGINALP